MPRPVTSHTHGLLQKCRKNWFIWTCLFVFVVIAFTRVPKILTQGRFWAEEGHVFYYNAATMPFLKALLNPFGGYLNIVANAAAIVARYCMTPRYAPYCTTLIALLFQLLPVYLLITARDAWLQSRTVRAVGVACILFVPASTEIWLQTLHCQMTLALACALILSLDTRPGWLPPATMFLAPLAGPGAVALAPLVMLRAVLERSSVRIIQCAALVCGTSLQLAFFYSPTSSRGSSQWLGSALAAIFCREPMTLLLGRLSHTTKAVTNQLHAELLAHPTHLVWAQPLLILFFLPFLALGLLSPRSRVCLWFTLANAVFSGAAMFGSIGGAIDQITLVGDERYFFVGEVLCELAMLAAAVTAPRRWMQVLAWVLTLWMIAVGVREFWHKPFQQSGPSWLQETRKWKHDHTYELNIWPNSWRMQIP